jgi:tRNA G18 (ribose-2'-O)-methylase SpoU
MALVPPLDYTPAEVRSLLRPLRNRVSVAVYSAQNAFAVGAIIRVAHSFLVREIILIGESPWYEKASMGMQRFEEVAVLADEDAFFEHTRERPLWAIEKDHATQSLYDVISYPDDVVLVFGSERAGLPGTILERADAVLGIPMYGVNHSLPLAVAAGIVMSDWARRRYAPGTTISGPSRGERASRGERR